jgi:pimeloyl-ACP methyl ester carboxylesterase
MIDTILDFMTRNWALLSIGPTLLVLVLVPWLVLRKYLKIALNIVGDTIPPLGMGLRDFTRLEGEVVDFRAFDGLRLRGMFLFGNASSGPKGMIIFAHEFQSDMYSCARYCRGLLEAGYDIFSFDFRCHGGSSVEEGYRPLQWCTDRELSDILGAIAHVEDWLEQQGRPKDIGLFGICRGAAATLLATWHNTAIRAVLVDGAFSTDKIIEHFMKHWAGIFAKVRFVYENHPPVFWRFMRWMLFRLCRRKLGIKLLSVRKALLGMEPRPIFFIHGEKDGYIPVDQTRMLYATAKDPKFLWIVPRASHNQSTMVAPRQYAEKTAMFFDCFLADLQTQDGSLRMKMRDEQLHVQLGGVWRPGLPARESSGRLSHGRSEGPTSSKART